MAFATSNIRRGTLGDLKVTAGNWTGSTGDADGSFIVEGGIVYLTQFRAGDGTTPDQFILCSVTASSTGTVTITVPNRKTVARGSFIVIHA